MPTHVYAHTAAKGAGDFYAGLLHPVTALEHILPFVTLGLLAGQQGPKAQGSVLVFALTLMAGAAVALWVPALPFVGLVNILSAVMLGILVAAAWRLPLALLYGITVLFGLSHGFANGTAISEGLKPGQVVVTDGQDKLQDGTQVIPNRAPAGDSAAAAPAGNPVPPAAQQPAAGTQQRQGSRR